jgi:citrate synthase
MSAPSRENDVPGWIDAKTATQLLGVSRGTLYAYVSRGFVRSQAAPGAGRERRYAREDVDRLRVRSEERRRPAGGERLSGLAIPPLESQLTRVRAGAHHYRGHEVSELARGRSLEEVAALLWTGGFEPAFVGTALHVVSGRADSGTLPFISRAQSVLPLVAASDPLSYDLRPRAVAQTGWRILNLLTSVAAETSELEETIEETLVTGWKIRGRGAASIVRAALILSADDEPDTAALTARCVASTGASPYAAVLAALAALEGSKQGGVTLRAAILFDELRRTTDLKRALAERLRRGEGVEGFGHRLHPEGDPRAATLIDLLPDSKESGFARSLAAAAAEVIGEQPSLDFALVAAARTLGLPGNSALTLFALGRTIGWIAHAMDQYAQPAMITPPN